VVESDRVATEGHPYNCGKVPRLSNRSLSYACSKNYRWHPSL